MATGPCTMLLRRGGLSGTFEDRAGTQDLAFFEDRAKLRRHTDASGNNEGTVGLYELTNYLQTPSLPSAAGGVFGWTGTNGTISDEFRVSTALGEIGAYNSYIYGSGCIRLKATAANAKMEAPVVWPGSLNFGLAFLIHNRAASARTFQAVFDGADKGSPISIPANTVGLLYASAGFQITSPKNAGFRVTNSVNGETFDLWHGVASPSVISVNPLPCPAYVSTIPYDGSVTTDPSPPWTGTAYNSQSSREDSWWEVPLTQDRFSSERGALMIRADLLPPHISGAGYWLGAGISRRAQSDGSWFDNYWLLAFAEDAPNQLAWFLSARERSVSGFDYEHGSNNMGLPARDSGLNTWFASWNTHGYELSANTVAPVGFDWENQASDWPFTDTVNTDYVLHPSTLYKKFDAYSPVKITDVMIFDRELNSAERAYLADLSSMLAINTFARPESASVLNVSNWTRGDTQLVDVQILDADGSPVPLAGQTVWMTFKTPSDTADNDTTAVVDAYIVFGNDGVPTSSAGLSATDVANGQLLLTILAADADSFVPGEMLRWDIQIKDISGQIHTVAKGSVTIDADVTRRVVTP